MQYVFDLHGKYKICFTMKTDVVLKHLVCLNKICTGHTWKYIINQTNIGREKIMFKCLNSDFVHCGLKGD